MGETAVLGCSRLTFDVVSIAHHFRLGNVTMRSGDVKSFFDRSSLTPLRSDDVTVGILPSLDDIAFTSKEPGMTTASPGGRLNRCR